MPIQFIYATDLHGNFKKFNTILQYAIKHNIKIIHLGADLLPKSINNTDIYSSLNIGISDTYQILIKKQKHFINTYLKDFFQSCKDNNITTLCFFGNDDNYSLKPDLKQYCSLLNEQPITLNDFTFMAYEYVCDYPFKNKTACKLDNKFSIHEKLDYLGQTLRNCFEHITDYQQIKNLEHYFSTKSTIEDDLINIKIPQNTIFSFHMPPNKINLDCVGQHSQNKITLKSKVGSSSIYNWISNNQPTLTLSGHIHENFEVTGKYKEFINNSLVIQPGQMKLTRFVIITINDSINTQLIEL